MVRVSVPGPVFTNRPSVDQMLPAIVRSLSMRQFCETVAFGAEFVIAVVHTAPDGPV